MPLRPHRSPDAVAYGIDLIAALRGVSTAFTVLVVGNLATFVVIGLLPSPTAVSIWVGLVFLVAVVLAGSWIGEATNPGRHGAMAALAAFVLFLPLVALVNPHALVWWQVLLTALGAAAVGGLAGLVAGRRRGPVAP